MQPSTGMCCCKGWFPVSTNSEEVETLKASLSSFRGDCFAILHATRHPEDQLRYLALRFRLCSLLSSNFLLHSIILSFSLIYVACYPPLRHPTGAARRCSRPRLHLVTVAPPPCRVHFFVLFFPQTFPSAVGSHGSVPIASFCISCKILRFESLPELCQGRGAMGTIEPAVAAVGSIIMILYLHTKSAEN